MQNIVKNNNKKGNLKQKLIEKDDKKKNQSQIDTKQMQKDKNQLYNDYNDFLQVNDKSGDFTVGGGEISDQKARLDENVKIEGIAVSAEITQNRESVLDQLNLAKDAQFQKNRSQVYSKQRKQKIQNNSLSGDILKASNKSNFLLAASGGSFFGLIDLKQKEKAKESTGFVLFTHQAKRELEGTQALILDYENLRIACMELYLSVKIRSDSEIEAFSKEKFEEEKRQLAGVDGFTLVDYIKKSIEQLMNMKMDEGMIDDNNYQFEIDGPEIDIELPEAAKHALKDATAKNEMIQKILNSERINNQIHEIQQKKKNVKDYKKIIEQHQKIMNLESNMDTIEQKINKDGQNNETAINIVIQKSESSVKNEVGRSVTNQSQTTSLIQLQNKLQEVESPSSSKPDEDDEDYYMENEDNELYNIKGDGLGSQTDGDITSNASIPMAHREYEKILRQLESECRTHIKCEQQMKLHIECLQEKLDTVQKENENFKEKEDKLNQQNQDFSTKVKSLQEQLEKMQQDLSQKNEKLKKSEQVRESVLVEMKAENLKNNQIIQQLEKKLENIIEQNKILSAEIINFKSTQKNSNDYKQFNQKIQISPKQLGVNGVADYSDPNKNIQQFQAINYNGGFATATGGNNQNIIPNKAIKYENENQKKVNQRSQSVLKSHNEFNHNFTNNHATSASIGSSTTQRANLNAVNQVPGSKSTSKGVGQQAIIKSIAMAPLSVIQQNTLIQQQNQQTGSENRKQSSHQRKKALVNVNDKFQNISQTSIGVPNILITSSKQLLQNSQSFLSDNSVQPQNFNQISVDSIVKSNSFINIGAQQSNKNQSSNVNNPYTVESFQKVANQNQNTLQQNNSNNSLFKIYQNNMPSLPNGQKEIVHQKNMSTDRIYAQDGMQSSPNTKIKSEKKSDLQNINNSAAIKTIIKQNSQLQKSNAPNQIGYSQNENKIIRKHIPNQSADHIQNSFSNISNAQKQFMEFQESNLLEDIKQINQQQKSLSKNIQQQSNQNLNSTLMWASNIQINENQDNRKQNKNQVQNKSQNKQNDLVQVQTKLNNAIVTTNKQGQQAQIKINSGTFYLSQGSALVNSSNKNTSNVYQTNQGKSLAQYNEGNDPLSIIKNQQQTHSSSFYKHQPARSITKLEKNSFQLNSGQVVLLAQNSNPPNQTLRSKSNGRQLTNSYGKLVPQQQPMNAFTNRQLIDNQISAANMSKAQMNQSLIASSQNLITEKQNSQLQNINAQQDHLRQQSQSVNQFVNIYKGIQNNNQIPTIQQHHHQKTKSSKFTNQFSERNNSESLQVQQYQQQAQNQINQYQKQKKVEQIVNNK